MATDTLSEGKGIQPYALTSSVGAANLKGIKVVPIGTMDTFLKTYITVKQIQTLIDFKAKYVVKDGYFISSLDEKNKAAVEKFFRSIPIEEIIVTWDKNARIYGNGYLEFTGDNLIPRDSRKIFAYIDEEGHGQVVGYVQEVGNNSKDWPVFDPEEMLHLKNNPIDHVRGLSEFLGYEDIIELDDSVMQDIRATLNRQAYPRKHYVIGSPEKPVAPDSDKFINAQGLIEGLLPGEDVITNHEIVVNDIGGKQAGNDFKDYVNMINERITMQALIPSDFWFGASSGPTIDLRKRLFEETEIMSRRRQIEDIINRELIPQLISVKEDEPVLFKFGDINTEMAFIKAKIDLTHLQTGSKTPNELRLEKGLDPIEGGDVQNTQTQQVPISSKDSTSESTIGGNLTGARPANGQ